MQRYHYTARRSAQELEEGVLEGDSAEAVARSLTSQGLFPVHVVELSRGANAPSTGLGGRLASWRGRRRARISDQALVARQLADLVGGGLTVHAALGTLTEQARDTYMQEILGELRASVMEGRSLSEALEKQGRLFSVSAIGTIRAGEASGALEEVLHSIADLLEEEDDLVRKVREALTYPTLVAIVGVLTLIVLFSYVIPRITVLYSDIGQLLPLPTRVLLSFSAGFRTYGVPALVALAVLTPLALRRMRASHRLHARMAGWVLGVPVIGRVVLYREIVRFARSLATLTAGGVPLVRALELTGAVAGNEHIRQQLREVQVKVQEGGKLGQALRDSSLLAGPLVPMVQVGEESGQLSEALRKGARFYQRDLDSTLKKVTTLIEPILILCLGIIVGFVVFAMMLPILQVDLMLG